MTKPTLYFAAPLFSQAELAFNQSIAERLEAFFAVYLPQRDGGLFAKMVEAGILPNAASGRIFALDLAAINRSDVLLIILDGRAVDEGAAFELGYAHAIGKVCIGLQTDPRRLLPFGNNPMITGPLITIFVSVDALLSWASSFATIVANEQNQRYTNDAGSKL